MGLEEQYFWVWVQKKGLVAGTGYVSHTFRRWNGILFHILCKIRFDTRTIQPHVVLINQICISCFTDSHMLEPRAAVCRFQGLCLTWMHKLAHAGFLWSGLLSPSTCLPDFRPILRHTWLFSSWEPWWSSYALATHDDLITTSSSLQILGGLESAKWAFRSGKFAQLMSYSHECIIWLTLIAFPWSEGSPVNLVARY